MILAPLTAPLTDNGSPLRSALARIFLAIATRWNAGRGATAGLPEGAGVAVGVAWGVDSGVCDPVGFIGSLISIGSTKLSCCPPVSVAVTRAR